MSVRFIRWARGYFEFTVEGKFPERFLNLTARRGIILWDIKGEKNRVTACARDKDRAAAECFAKKTGGAFTVTKRHGLPLFCRQRRHRWGILAGLIAGVAVYSIMSGYIWNIEIIVPRDINSFEIRQQLRELGFTEGSRFRGEEINRIERELILRDKRIGWVSINIQGANATVRLTSKKTANENKKSSEKNRASNMIASEDGIITGIKARRGTPAVKPGTAVRKGDLPISGVTEYNNNTTVFSDSEGEVPALVRRSYSISAPLCSSEISLSDRETVKKEVRIFTFPVPLSVEGAPEGKYISTESSAALSLPGGVIPISLRETRLRPYTAKSRSISYEEAVKQLKKRELLLELFISGEGKNKIRDKKTAVTETSGGCTLRAEYELEKDICKKNYIELRN